MDAHMLSCQKRDSVLVALHGRLMNFTDAPVITPPPLPSFTSSPFLKYPFAASEGSKGGGVPGPVSGSPTSESVTGSFNSLSTFGSTKNDEETKFKVVTDIQGPVIFDEDFLLDL